MKFRTVIRSFVAILCAGVALGSFAAEPIPQQKAHGRADRHEAAGAGHPAATAAAAHPSAYAARSGAIGGERSDSARRVTTANTKADRGAGQARAGRDPRERRHHEHVDPALRNALNVNFRTVTCAGLEFELSPGETLASLIGRIPGAIAGALQCANPGNWREVVFNPLTWLNQQTDAMLDKVKANNSLLNTQSHYDQVVVMEDANAVPDKVIAAMRSLAPTHTLDVHVLTHGSSGAFFGQSGAAFNETTFFALLWLIATPASCI